MSTITQTSQVFETIEPAAPTPHATPTIDVTKYTNKWSTYTNLNLGISFEYPALYDELPVASCRPHINQDNPTDVYVGVHINISLLGTANQVQLPQFVNELLLTNSDWELHEQADVMIANPNR